MEGRSFGIVGAKTMLGGIWDGSRRVPMLFQIANGSLRATSQRFQPFSAVEVQLRAPHHITSFTNCRVDEHDPASAGNPSEKCQEIYISAQTSAQGSQACRPTRFLAFPVHVYHCLPLTAPATPGWTHSPKHTQSPSSCDRYGGSTVQPALRESLG